MEKFNGAAKLDLPPQPFVVPAAPVEKVIGDRAFGGLFYNYSVVLGAAQALIARETSVRGAPLATVAPSAVVIALDHVAMLALSSFGSAVVPVDRFSPKHFGESAERIAREAMARMSGARHWPLAGGR